MDYKNINNIEYCSCLYKKKSLGVNQGFFKKCRPNLTKLGEQSLMSQVSYKLKLSLMQYQSH